MPELHDGTWFDQMKEKYPLDLAVSQPSQTDHHGLNRVQRQVYE
jgi:hypothetical protein